MTRKSVAQRLDEVRQQKNLTVGYWIAVVDAERDKVQRVRELHPPRAGGRGLVCEHCELPWPCPTTQALGEP